MRKLVLLILISVCQYTLAININKKTIAALEHISNGYVQYGCEELKKTAAMNDLAAQFYVGVCYENGIGVDKDLSQAFKMYRKAAERGLPDAMFRLASFYKDGVIVPRDIARESEWMKRYSQKGGEPVLADLISIYNEGVKHSENYALNPNGDEEDKGNQIAQFKNQESEPVQDKKVISPIVVQQPKKENRSDVDINIPITQLEQKNTFVLIIANENYQEVSKVPNALNDGAVFKEYCIKTLGIPQGNIKHISDATLNGMKRQITWLTQVIDVYKGQASVILYYAGHGIPDESNRESFMLPVDGYGNDTSSGYSLEKLYKELGSKPAKSVLVLLDACFSGASRDGSMLASARGVAIKAKQDTPQGNVVVISASQGDETAYPYKEKGHGLFTYYLLKKIQESKGNTTFGELADYISTEVKKASIVINGKMQTPLVSPSSNATDWRNWKFR
ncbi:caspase family protein [Xylanibacter ruminicola]|uniref:Sel1 repeat-containing protein n=1 Tax=Xylanibacter ruminicola TaxID=839 RepID=A0A1M6TIL7_XYLRU|nr:caspase family protein [Xylanibacter ruminicola]SHK56759.1 Sel1 repeat-containing protein [Xylanibacter ruminicola]